MGYIKSINPLTFDSGPGIRVEVLLSNAPNSFELTAIELINQVRKFRPYFGPNYGGITFKGDIINQQSFIIESCIIAHKAGITTCIEINELSDKVYDLFKDIDIIILNIIDINKIEFDKLNIKKIYINQIIKRNINDNIEYINLLKKYVSKCNIKLISNEIEYEEIKELERILYEKKV